LVVALQVDPVHPRWPRRPTGTLLVGASLGVGLGPTLGSDAEQACPANCFAAQPAFGSTVFARGGYELPLRLSFDGNLGYVAASRVVERKVQGPLSSDYAMRDAIGFSGFAFGIGAAYRLPLSRVVDFAPRLTGGLVLATSSDSISGTAVTRVDSAPVQVENANQEVSSTPVFLYPEVGITATVGRFRLGGSLGAFTVLGSGPALDHGAVAAPASLCSANGGGSAACLPDSDVIQQESAYDSFVLFAAQISATYVL
jgi:hypothetical protein